MTFLPIVARELRVASRRRWTYWGRFSAALLAVMAASVVLVLGRRADPREIGPVLFDTLAVLGFFCIAIFGTQLTCGCLSTERREGTLGLLFLTDLRGYDVVFGKLAATSLHAAYSLLSVLPILAIPLLLGGVAAGEIWRVALVSANLLFFFLSVGMFSSSVCRQDHRALALAVFISLAALLAGPLLYAGLSLHRNASPSNWWLRPCPAVGCITAFEDNYRTGTVADFWWSVGITQLYAWICLLLACWVVPRSWQETAAGPKRGKWRDQWRAFSEGSAAAREAVRRKWLAINPFLWRAGRPRAKYFAPWVFLALAATLWYASGKLFENERLFDEPNDIVWASVVHFIFKVWVASEACRCFAEDRRSGALELLLTTPLGVNQIVRGQRKALWRQFAAPVAAVLLVDLLFLNRAMSYIANREDRQGFILFYLIEGAFFVFDMYAISWFSMRLGLTGRKPIRIIMLSFWWTVLLPGLVSFVTTYAYLITRGLRGNPTPLGVALIWAIPSLTADVIVFATGRFNILKRFREGDVERAGTVSPAVSAR